MRYYIRDEGWSILMTYVFNLYNLRNVCNVSHFHCFGTPEEACTRVLIHSQRYLWSLFKNSQVFSQCLSW